MMTRLDSRATSDSDFKYWTKPVPAADKKNPWNERPNSVNVEMTAYALQAYLLAGQEQAAFPILKWLISQRNEQGGFQSTQDTVVGITALAEMGGRLGSGNVNAAITVHYNDKQANIKVEPGNALVLQSYLLPNTIKTVNITATGEGVSLAQLSYRYNVNVTGAWPRFTLDPRVSPNSNPDNLQLTVCTTFVPLDGPKNSGMVVMEIEFPSGLTADKETLFSLENYKNTIKRVETKNGDSVVILYLDSLNSTELCPTVNAYRTSKVANQKPASVQIYNYYDNSQKASTFYSVPATSICDICDDCDENCAPQAEAQKGETDDNKKGGALFLERDPSTNEPLFISAGPMIKPVATLALAATAAILNNM